MPDKTTESRLSCEQCCEKIPHSTEAKEYVLFFCGLDCYEKWQHKTPNSNVDENQILVHNNNSINK